MEVEGMTQFDWLVALTILVFRNYYRIHKLEQRLKDLESFHRSLRHEHDMMEFEASKERKE